jgi:hypothetical protein
VNVGALGELLQFVQLGVAGLVHKEHAMHLERVFGKQFLDFLESADSDLRCGISVAHGGHDVLGARTVSKMARVGVAPGKVPRAVPETALAVVPAKRAFAIFFEIATIVVIVKSHS